MSHCEMQEMIHVATEMGLPRQVIDCLVECGYDTLDVVADLDDIGEIESFLRQNSFLFKAPEKRRRLYGPYEENPLSFSFLPGHRKKLKKFIELCASWQSAKGIKSMSNLNTFRQSFSDRSTADEFKMPRESECRVNPVETSTSKPSCCGSPLYNNDNSTNFVSDSSSDVDRAISSPPLPVSFTAAEIYSDIERRLQKWSLSHKSELVRQLLSEKHYRILVESQLREPNDSDTDVCGTPLRVSYRVIVLCNMCSSEIRLHPRGNSFTTSNATRHLLSCTGVSSRSATRRQSTKKSSSDEFGGDQSRPHIGAQCNVDVSNRQHMVVKICPDSLLEPLDDVHPYDNVPSTQK